MATGFIGIGIMGEGMAGCLLKAGKKLVVWNRDASKAQKLATAYPGLVTVVASPGDVVDALACLARAETEAVGVGEHLGQVVGLGDELLHIGRAEPHPIHRVGANLSARPF